jgi:hypothetical protein
MRKMRKELSEPKDIPERDGVSFRFFSIRGLRRTAVGLILFACLTVPGPVLAMDRGSALHLYRAVSEARETEAGWTGSTRSCRVGTESSRSIEATLLTVNALREFVGLQPVKFNAEKNRSALTAAMMMAANGRLSHAPDARWRCYSEIGAGGAGSSNLYLGVSGPSAIVGYAFDTDVKSLGHRRWLFDPTAEEFGTGSTGRSNALHVTGAADDPEVKSRYGFESWPSPGYFPWPWVPRTWSVNLHGAQLRSGEEPRVTVRVTGEKLPVTDVSVPSGGYGAGTTISWQTGISKRVYRTEKTFEVVLRQGDEVLARYEVKPFRTTDRPLSPLRVRRPQLRLRKVVEQPKRLKFALGFGRKLKGRQAYVKIVWVLRSCDSTGYCVDSRSKVLRDYRVRVSKSLRIRLRKPPRLSTMTVRVMVPGWSEGRTRFKTSSTARTILGPGLHW